ncbi:MAG: AEC family transporter [Planctomycetota bacterium]
MRFRSDANRRPCADFPMQIANIVLPVFLVIGLGYFLAATGSITRETNGAFSKLVFYVAAPALLFRGAALSPVLITRDLKLLVVTSAVTLLVAAAVYVAAARTHPSRRGVLTQGTHRANMVFVGLPVIANAFGTEAVGRMALLIGFMVVFYNLLAVMALVLPHQESGLKARDVWRKTALGILGNPLILGSGAGILVSALQGELPLFLDRALDLVGEIAMPLALLSVGAGLDFRRLRRQLGATVAVSLVKLVAYPALVYVCLLAAGFRGLDLQCPVLILASPTAVVSYIMAQEMRGDEQLAGAIIIGTTVGSLVTISGWLAFLLS